MPPLPPVLSDVAWRSSLRLGRDHYMRVATNGEPGASKATGRRVQVSPSSTRARTSCSSARPAIRKTHHAIGISIRAWQAGHCVAFPTAAEWVARLADAHAAG